MSKLKPKLRPELERTLTPEEFSEYYWLKSELQEFCSRFGLTGTGGKLEIAERIRNFLMTGSIPIKIASKNASQSSPQLAAPFTLNTPVGGAFKCTREIREFFESHAGAHFHFSVELQRCIKQNQNMTFGDVITEWKRLRELKKSGKLKTKIGAQFEYNQFTRDFFADPKNHGKTRADCVAAWKELRSQRGKPKYRS